MAKLRIGTCSWKFASWVGLVYTTPEGAPPAPSSLPEDASLFAPLRDTAEPPPLQAHYLVEYAAQYDTVEVDQWFWSLFGPEKVSLPKPGDVTAYRAAVPDDFRFAVRAPNSVTLTHFYAKRNKPLVANPHFVSVDVFERFLDLLAPLYPLLGPVMFQFDYLNHMRGSSPLTIEKLWGWLREG